MTDNATKLSIVIVYMVGLLVLGWVASRRIRDSRDYFAANKQLGFWATAMSARATGESAWLLLGLTGLGAAMGLHAMWVVLGETLGVAAAWLLMAHRFKRLTDRYDSITIPDYLESRFRDGAQLIRKVSACALVIFVTIYVSAQIDATGTAFESFLGWDYYVGALVGFTVVLVYIVTGGFLAVAWSDVVQGTLMFIGLVVLPIVGVVAAGGWDAVTTGLVGIDPNLMSWSGTGSWTAAAIMSAVGFAMIGAGFLGSPQIFVRFLAIRDTSEIPKGTRVAIIWTVLADGGAVLTGMIGRHLLCGPGQELVTVLGKDGQDVLPLLVGHLFPVLVVGVYVAIVLSAIMSTVDSLLVMASSAIVRDWYQQVRHPELPDAALTGLSRLVTAGLAVFALLIALGVAWSMPDRTVFWFVIFGWSGIAATFCPTMIMSLYWKGLTVGGVIASMVTGFVCVPLFKFVIFPMEGIGTWLSPLSELPPAFFLSFIAGVLVSKLSQLDASLAGSRSEALGDSAQADLEWAARDTPT